MRKFLKNLIFLIDKIEKILCVYMLATIVIIMALEVIMRYIFNSPLTWALETSILLLIYLTYFAADIVYRGKGHISIVFFISLFSLKVKKIVNIVVYAFISVFLIVIFKESIILMRIQFSHSIAAVLPLTKSFWVLPVTLVFCSMFISTIYFILVEFES